MDSNVAASSSTPRWQRKQCTSAGVHHCSEETLTFLPTNEADAELAMQKYIRIGLDSNKLKAPENHIRIHQN